MQIIETYKNMAIYYNKNGILLFGNKSYTNAKAKSVRSAKCLITKYINKLSNKEKNKLKYIKLTID